MLSLVFCNEYRTSNKEFRMMKCFASDFDIPCSTFVFVPPVIGFRVRLASRVGPSCSAGGSLRSTASQPPDLSIES